MYLAGATIVSRNMHSPCAAALVDAASMPLCPHADDINKKGAGIMAGGVSLRHGGGDTSRIPDPQ